MPRPNHPATEVGGRLDDFHNLAASLATCERQPASTMASRPNPFFLDLDLTVEAMSQVIRKPEQLIEKTDEYSDRQPSGFDARHRSGVGFATVHPNGGFKPPRCSGLRA